MSVDIAGAERAQRLIESELSANTVAFISCRNRLTEVGAARGGKGSKGVYFYG